jgi:magnesium chelatase accessory protein
MIGKLVWERDGRDWPNRDASRFVRAGGLRWHVQKMGAGPVLLLVHGTGAATHSWRELAPLLARRFTVVAPDLPGHGFTQRPGSYRMSLPAMARALRDLLKSLESEPVLVAGHSAGAAILARMSLDGYIAPKALVSLNGALLGLSGLPRHVFSPVAKLLAGCPAFSYLFAWRAANRAMVERLLRDTGSVLDAQGVEFYSRLARSPNHVAAALSMMANWDLGLLERQLPGIAPRLLLVAGGNDRTIPPADALRVRSLLPSADVVTLAGLGHLAHEERPAEIAEQLTNTARSANVLT